MKRTKIQSPDQLAPRARAWELPRVNAGGIKVPLEQLHQLAAEDESTRSLRRRGLRRLPPAPALADHRFSARQSRVS